MKVTTLSPIYPLPEITNNFVSVKTVENENMPSEEFFIVLEEILSSDHSTNTKKAIVSDMKHFYRWYISYNKEVFAFARCIRDDVIAYKANLLSENKATRSINRKLSHLRIFFRKAQEMEYITKDPTMGVRKLPAQIGRAHV